MHREPSRSLKGRKKCVLFKVVEAIFWNFQTLWKIKLMKEVLVIIPVIVVLHLQSAASPCCISTSSVCNKPVRAQTAPVSDKQLVCRRPNEQMLPPVQSRRGSSAVNN